MTLLMFVVGALLLIAFAVIEARAAAPLLPLRIVMDRNRVGAYSAIMVAFCSMCSAFLFLTYYAQQNLRYSPLKTGVAFLPMAAGIAVAAGIANARLIPRRGPRRVVPPGMLIAAGGMFWLAQLDVHSSDAGDVLGPLVVLGVGIGLTFAPAIATATAGIADEDAGVASAMVNTSQQIGGAIGTAALSTIFASALTRYMTSHRPPNPALRPAAAIHGYTVAFGVSCVLFLAGAVVTALLLRRMPVDSGEPADHEPGDDTDRVSREVIHNLERQIARLEAEKRYLAAQLSQRYPMVHPTPTSHSRHSSPRKPMALRPLLFGTALGTAVIVAAVLAASLGSPSHDEVVRSCVTNAKAQVEHYRPGYLYQLTDARDCESIVGR